MAYKYDVFLSHNSKDKPAVEIIAKALQQKYEIKCWLDKWNLVSGEPWQEALEEALDQCQTVAVFVGPNTISPWENEEMRSVLEERVHNKARRVVPVLLPGSPDAGELKLPRFLKRLTWVDLRAGVENEEALYRLACGIKGIPPGNLADLAASSSLPSSEKLATVQLILEGEFSEFSEIKRDDLVGVLAALLHVDRSSVKILRTYSGSIIVELELTEVGATKLLKYFEDRDVRLKKLGIRSVKLLESPGTVSPVPASLRKTRKATGQKRSVTIIAAWIGLLGALIVAIATIAAPVIERWLNPPAQETNFSGRIVDNTDLSPIVGAKVSIDLRELPIIVYSDSEGIYRFTTAIKSTTSGQIRVDAQGYQTYIRNIQLPPAAQTIEDIRLTASGTSVTPTSPTPISSATPATACDEKNKIAEMPIGVRFRRWQGVSLFAVENAPEHAILSNMLRALTVDQRGLWIGYFPMENNPSAGLGFFDKTNWYECNSHEGVNGQNVNDIAIDGQGHIWVALEKAGVALHDGEKWRRFTTADGLPSEDVFRITIDSNGAVWIGTWEGVAKFDGTRWSTPYSAENKTLRNNHVAAILFDPQGDIWLGHIDRGISLYKNSEGKWEFIQASEGGLGGNKVRAFAVQAASEDHPESIWVATADDGLSQYSNGTWTQYHVQDGLPDEDVRDVQVDSLNRIWVATAKGVIYLENGQWNVYDTYDTARIAFGIACPDKKCPYDEDQVWTATSGFGLTHSRLPRPNMLDVPEVCFVIDDQDRTCVTPVATEAPNTVEAVLPTPVSPGQKIRFEITVSPRSPYELIGEGRGDFLSFAEESDSNLFGAYTQIGVKGTVASGQTYVFTDYDNPMIVPERNVPGQEFTSTWRVWLHTRYAGPVIKLKYMRSSGP